MSKFGKLLGLILLMGIIGSICFLADSTLKREYTSKKYSQTEYTSQMYHVEIHESICKEIDSLKQYYNTVVGVDTIPQEVLAEYFKEVREHYKNILYIIYKPDHNILQLGWKDD